MSNTWFRVHPWSDERICSVEIERHTAHFVTLVGSKMREARISEFSAYFPTWSEARQYLLDRASARLQSTKIAFDQAKEEYRKIVELREDASASDQS